MEADRSLMMLDINPERYPEMEISFNEISEHEDKLFETKVTFPKEFWLNLVETLNQVSNDMGGDDPVRSGFNLISQRIMAEIKAEDRRLKFREAYESFADFVIATSKRADLDNVRKGQIIHDMASQLKLEA
jgi:hypothetical protein